MSGFIPRLSPGGRLISGIERALLTSMPSRRSAHAVPAWAPCRLRVFRTGDSDCAPRGRRASRARAPGKNVTRARMTMADAGGRTASSRRSISCRLCHLRTKSNVSGCSGSTPGVFAIAAPSSIGSRQSEFGRLPPMLQDERHGARTEDANAVIEARSAAFPSFPRLPIYCDPSAARRSRPKAPLHLCARSQLQRPPEDFRCRRSHGGMVTAPRSGGVRSVRNATAPLSTNCHVRVIKRSLNREPIFTNPIVLQSRRLFGRVRVDAAQRYRDRTTKHERCAERASGLASNRRRRSTFTSSLLLWPHSPLSQPPEALAPTIPVTSA